MIAQVCEENESSHTSKLIDCGPPQGITEDAKQTRSNSRAVFPLHINGIHQQATYPSTNGIDLSAECEYKHYLRSALTYQTNYGNADHNKSAKQATSCT